MRFRVSAGVKEFSFQVDFSWVVMVFSVKSCGGESGDFEISFPSAERENDCVVFSVENWRPAFTFNGCSGWVRLSFR